MDVDKTPVFVRVRCTPLGGPWRPAERFFTLPYLLPCPPPVRPMCESLLF